MSKLGYTPGCSVLDPWLDPLVSPSRPRRRSLRWGLAFHKDHDHPHDHMGRPGPARYAGPSRQVYTIGIAGPVGSGKTALVEALCRALWPEVNLAVITNDIYTHEDAEFLSRREVLPVERIVGVQTKRLPRIAAIRDAASANLSAVANFQRQVPGLELVLVESGGDNLTAVFSCASWPTVSSSSSTWPRGQDPPQGGW